MLIKVIILLLIALPLIKLVLALRHPNILSQIEGGRAQRMLEGRWGKGRPDDLVSEVGKRLLETNGLRAQFLVLRGEPINAVALPHGLIFVWNGLLRYTGSDQDMIAGVLAHELGHLVRGHYLARIRLLSVVQFALGALGGNLLHSIIRNGVWAIITSGFSRAQEEEADEAAVRILLQAGYDPNGLVRLFDALAGTDSRGGFLGTHPEPRRRAEQIRRRLAAKQK